MYHCNKVAQNREVRISLILRLMVHTQPLGWRHVSVNNSSWGLRNHQCTKHATRMIDMMQLDQSINVRLNDRLFMLN